MDTHQHLGRDVAEREVRHDALRITVAIGAAACATELGSPDDIVVRNHDGLTHITSSD